MFFYSRICLTICLFQPFFCVSGSDSSDQCSFVNDCSCRFKNGSFIDISSLGTENGPRWRSIKAVLNNDTSTYSYNGCSRFSMGQCQNVFVCQETFQKDTYDCGDKAYFSGDGLDGKTYLTISGDKRTTVVTLVCSPNALFPDLTVAGETSPTKYDITLVSRCACADLCHERHLSFGSVLVIVFLIFAFLYLVLGIVHSSLTRGAHGWELLPHYEFWADFPLLVRDGCVFVVSGCKTDTAYERI